MPLRACAGSDFSGNSNGTACKQDIDGHHADHDHLVVAHDARPNNPLNRLLDRLGEGFRRLGADQLIVQFAQSGLVSTYA